MFDQFCIFQMILHDALNVQLPPKNKILLDI